ncbi:hypothetical protein NCG89_15480 [Spongiibacter taiwanensis]|uniref:hypothetical protein n=1 Tax=Spongiibacter taiwanensis TaxID=1748242 RepID=UPI0020351CCA|nr:hypothetical protein [Spongiibacter taiwanensis]USA42926.1 hypothetical protein NCG89_15480 [Spongiibacter taiwanensis]
MDIESFATTLSAGLLIGFLLGLYSRLAYRKVRELLFRVYATPKHLRPFEPSKITTTATDSSAAE